MTAVVILAGGAGRRLGGNKPFHPYGDSTLIETVVARLRPQIPPQTEALFINCGSHDHPLAERLARLGLPMVWDERHANMGPLSGVLAALALARERGDGHVITLPCDMPRLPGDIVEHLIAAQDGDVAFFAGRRDHPLCARWAARLEGRLAAALAQAAGGLAVQDFLADTACIQLPVSDEAAFCNINRSPD